MGQVRGSGRVGDDLLGQVEAAKEHLGIEEGLGEASAPRRWTTGYRSGRNIRIKNISNKNR